MMTASGSEQGQGEPDLNMVVRERPQLINIAYRLLGSAAEAEDAVQDAFARWYALDRQEQAAIAAPGAWLSRVVSRTCLNQLSSARVRRERYVGEWIPEPVPERAAWITGVPDSVASDPADRVALDESITMAFLVVLESMTPAERVAFILHDVFCYPFAEVAEIVGRSPAACRQLASSARRRVPASADSPTPRSRRAGIVSDFKLAWQAKDIDALVSLLAPDATAVADGGGKVSALVEPVGGAREIAERCVDIALSAPDLTIVESIVNGQPGLVGQRDGTTVVVVSFDIADDRIQHLWAVLNPDKLQPWTAS